MIPQVPPARVILLSGASSSGKSTIAKLLQAQLDEQFLHMELDAFINMLPASYNLDNFQAMVKAFHHSVAATADSGCNIIVDHVLIENDWWRELTALLASHSVLLVGLECGLDELERREKLRDKRRQGFARSQYDKIHAGKKYDLIVNTETTQPDQCAAKILEFYRIRGLPTCPGRTTQR